MSTAAVPPGLAFPRSERKKTARKIFEIDDGAPQHRAKPKCARKPSALGPKAASSASAEDPEFDGGQTWANDPRSQASLEVLERAIDLVPNMRAAPSFLGTNSQAHPNPFSPIADLMDNGIEAGASEMRISLHKLRGEPMLTMTDDGRGMTERALLDGPLSLCYTSKHGTHYGMGATTSIPAIGGFCLIFSVTAGGHRTLGFLSSKLSAKVQASQTKMPQCTWTPPRADGTSELLATQGADAPLGLDARRASLQVILEFSPYPTEAALLEVFAGMPPHGTRLVMWDLAKGIYRPDEAAHDVINAKAPPDSHPHETSLRALMEVIYYCDDELPPPMALWLMGTQVVPRNWSAYLHLSRRYSLSKSLPRAASSSFVEFGYRVPLPVLIDNFRSRSHTKDASLQSYSGVFYYNRDADKVRLIVPLEQSKVQKPMEQGKVGMAVTQRRICEWGFGLLGVCVEAHLRPAHNKREYLSHATNSEVHALFKSVDERMRRHLKECVVDCFRSAVAPLSNLPRETPPLPAAPCALAPSSRGHPPARDHAHAATAGHRGANHGTVGAGGTSYDGVADVERGPQRAPLAPKPAPAARFEEGQRVRAADGLCGRVCFDPAARGYYRLQVRVRVS